MVRSFIKSASVYTILGFVPSASRIILLPIFLLYLTPRDFGIIGLNTTLTSAIAIFMTLGFEHAFSRYYFDYKRNKKLLYKYFSTMMITVIIISTILSFLIIPFGEQLQSLLFKEKEFSFYPYGITALALAAISGVNGIILSYFRNEERSKSYLYFAGSLFLFSTVCEYIAIVYFHLGAAGVIFVKLAAMGAVSVVAWIAVLNEIGLGFEMRFLRSSLSYCLPIVPYIFFGFIYSSFDRIMIANNLDLTSLAVFNLAAAIAGFVEVGIQAIQNATYPSIYQLFKNGLEKNSGTINMYYRIIGLIILGGITLIVAFAPFLIITFLKPVYRPAVYLLPILLVGYIFRYLYVVYSEPLFFFKKTKKLPWLNVIAGVTIIGANLIFLPLIGLYGAAVSMLLSRAVQIIFTYYWASRVSEFRFQLKYVNVLILLLSVSLLSISFIGRFYESVPFLTALYAIPFLICLVFFVFRAYRGAEAPLSFQRLSSLKKIL